MNAAFVVPDGLEPPLAESKSAVLTNYTIGQYVGGFMRDF